jgi:mRNA-degrading endonuclease toxin of MazEF toxin-antitoxin module
MQPGEVVTADLTGGVGAEKDKLRPVVVVRVHGPTTLVVAVTDARKKRLPTHASLGRYGSGTTVKEALATCEHAWSLDGSRLAERAGAQPLTAAQLAAVGNCLRIAFGLTPPRPTPGIPKYRRGAVADVDFGVATGGEPAGVLPSLVLSNDTGNWYGQHLLVAPIVDAAVVGVDSVAGTVDLGRIRVVDLQRMRGDPVRFLDGTDLDPIGAGLRSIFPG